MTGEEIADGVVTVLNSMPAPLMEFTAVNVETPGVARESEDLSVHVWPYALTEEEIDRGGGWQVTAEVQIVVTATLSDSRTRADMIAFCAQLRERLRAQVVADARHQRTEVTALWDGESQRQQALFQSSMRAYFWAID